MSKESGVAGVGRRRGEAIWFRRPMMDDSCMMPFFLVSSELSLWVSLALLSMCNDLYWHSRPSRTLSAVTSCPLLISLHVTATDFFNVKHNALLAAPAMIIKAYLLTYNLLSAAAWSFVLYRTLSHLIPLQPPLAGLKASPSPFVPASLAPLYQRACTTYDAVGGTTAGVQTAALLEVLHVLLGFVRSPLSTTAVQVASRLFSVWGIAACFPSVRCSRSRSL